MKKILFLLMLLALVSTASAFTATETWSFTDTTGAPVTNVRALVYQCTDTACAPGFVNFQNHYLSGTSNQVDISYTTASASYFAVYLYADGYVPHDYRINVDQPYAPGYKPVYPIVFNKVDNCHAPLNNTVIQNMAFINQTLSIQTTTSLDAETRSAFTRLINTGAAFLPSGDPADLTDLTPFYSALTNINVSVYYENGTLADSKVINPTPNIYFDQAYDINFMLQTDNPAIYSEGNYTVVLTSNVIDNQCSSSIPETVTKPVQLLNDSSTNNCFAEVQNISFSPSLPALGDTITITAYKQSNFVSPAGSISPIDSNITLNVYDDNDTLVYTRDWQFGQNPMPDPILLNPFTVDWTPHASGQYTLELIAVPESSFCSGIPTVTGSTNNTLVVSAGTDPGNQAPVISNTQPAQLYNITLPQTVDFNATITDSDDLQVNYTFYIDNISVSNGTVASGSLVNFSNLFTTPQVYNISLLADDGTNQTLYEWTLNFTNYAPNITAATPATPVAVYQNNDTTFNVTVEDSEGADMNVTWYINGTYQTSAAVANGSYSEFTYNFTTVDDFNVSVVVTDNVGYTDFNEWIVDVNPYGCVIPVDNLYINADTTLCAGTYNLDDLGPNGLFIINASGVTLDGNGVVINGDGDEDGVVIDDATFDNVVIRNFNFNNFHEPIELDGEMFDRIENVSISNIYVDNSTYAVRLDYVQNATVSWIRGNTTHGLELESVTDSRIDGINLSCTSSCFLFEDGDNVGIDNGYFDGNNTAEGFDVTDTNLTIWDTSFTGLDKTFDLDNATVYLFNVTFIENNSSFLNGGQAIQYWYVNVHVNDTLSNNVSNASVEWTDVFNYTYTFGITDSNGDTSAFTLHSNLYNASGVTSYNNHTIDVSAAGYDNASLSYNVSGNSQVAMTLSPTFVDNPPIVTLISPADNSTVLNTDGNVTFNYTATDDYNLTNCTLYANLSGNWSAVATDASPVNGSNFWVVSNLSNGTYLWAVECWDGYPQAGWSTNYTFTMDRSETNTAPNITTSSPTSPQNITTNEYLSFNITAEDNEQVNLTSWWFVNNSLINSVTFANATDDGLGYNFTQPGLANVIVIVSDGTFNVSEQWDVNVTDPVVPPTYYLIINEFESNPASGSEWVEIYNPSNVTVNLTGWYLADSTASNNRSLSGELASGDYFVYNYSSPVLNNDGDLVRLFDKSSALVDDTPSLADSAGNDSCWARVPNAVDTNNSADWTFQQCTYNATNDLVVDNPPVVILNTPADNLTILNTDGNVTFNWTSTDDYGLYNCTLFANFYGGWSAAATITPVNGSNTYPLTNLSNGTYIWNVECFDSQNKSSWAAANYTFTMDTSSTNNPPNITASSPLSPVNLSTNDNQTFNITVEDPEGANLFVWWLVNGSYEQINNATNGSSVEFTRTFLTDGLHNVTAIVGDNATNISTEWVVNVSPLFVPATGIIINEFEADNEGNDSAEYIELYNPTNVSVNLSGWNITKSTGTTVITLYDNASIPALGYYTLNNSEYDLMLNGNISFELIRPDGEILDIVNVSSEDDLDNYLTWSRIPNAQDTNSTSDWQLFPGTFNQSNDNADWRPVVTLISPNATTENSTIVTVNYNVTDDHNVTSCRLYTNITGNWTNYLNDLDGIYDNFTITNLSNGAYAWNVRCFDWYGSSFAAENMTFTVILPATLTGTVTDVSNSTLNATVELKQSGVTYYITQAVNGTYTIDVPAGQYDVLIYSPGYVDNLTQNISLTSSNTTEHNVTLQTLVTTGNLTGYILDSVNTIYNAAIELKQGNLTVAATKSDENGTYGFTDVQQGTYNLTVAKSGFSVVVTEVTVNASNSTLQNVTIIPTSSSGRITGTVWDPSLNPVDLADVFVYETGTSNLVQIVKSDATGNYIVNGLPASVAYDLNASKVPTFNSTIFGPVNVVLAPGGTSSGKHIMVG
ncbi:lamin tail domain-containing protein [Candidatus Woesearchaeota archaeon]|nr:lamin tail domain-containing protein [Candidatus Woesearchaeota archaeon]